MVGLFVLVSVLGSAVSRSRSSGEALLTAELTSYGDRSGNGSKGGEAQQALAARAAAAATEGGGGDGDSATAAGFSTGDTQADVLERLTGAAAAASAATAAVATTGSAQYAIDEAEAGSVAAGAGAGSGLPLVPDRTDAAAAGGLTAGSTLGGLAG